MSMHHDTRQAHNVVGVHFPETSKPVIFVEGEDRITFLQGIMSQDISRQEEWSVFYSLFLNPKARILFDAWCSVHPESISLCPAPGTETSFIEHLKKYLFFRTKAKIRNRSEEFREIRLVGPGTITFLLPFLDHAMSGSAVRLLKNGGFAMIHPPTFQMDLNVGLQADLLVPVDQFDSCSQHLESSVKNAGGAILDEKGYMSYLTEKGIPLYPTEINESHFPAEAGLDTIGISYNKGCYVGQEPVTRLRFQGHLNRRLSGFVLSSPLSSTEPFPLTLLNPEDGSEAGILTRTAYSPVLKQEIGLGYLKKAFWEDDGRHELLLSDAQRLTSAPLPFV
ncbi:MAG: CAF17-like 4Fe-4S cluster assembly/insertion protein YgfZ [Leptospirales bacterium]